MNCEAAMDEGSDSPFKDTKACDSIVQVFLLAAIGLLETKALWLCSSSHLPSFENRLQSHFLLAIAWQQFRLMCGKTKHLLFYLTSELTCTMFTNISLILSSDGAHDES